MKIKRERKRRGISFIIPFVVIVLLFVGKFLIVDDPGKERIKASFNERTNYVPEVITYKNLIDDTTNIIISKGKLNVHLVKEYGVLKLVYIYKGELIGREKTDRFYLHANLHKPFFYGKTKRKITNWNFDFTYKEPISFEKEGTIYHIFSALLTNKLMESINKKLKVDDIKFIETGRFQRSGDRSESYTSGSLSLSNIPLASYAVVQEELKTYRILTTEESYKKITKKRAKALKTGILITAGDDLVKGKIYSSMEDKKNMEFRLKGDWVDHLGDHSKWSFRVIMGGEETFLGMRKFSFQHPQSRNYVWEWLFHKAIKEQGIVGLRYDFCKLQLNIKDGPKIKEKDLGIMAIEESFDKILIENNKRREGVIVAFDETILWNKREQGRRFGIKGFNEDRFIELAPIKVFNANKVLSDSALKRQFEIAKNLLDGLRNKKHKISEVFDLDKLTTFVALSNLFGAHHGLNVHNIRAYYNPITNKLEPIAFDALPGVRISNIVHYPFAKQDQLYRQKLLEKMVLFSKENFVNSLINENATRLEELISILSTEFNFNFQPKVLEHNSNFIKINLNPADIITAGLITIESDRVTLEVENLTDHNIRIKGLFHVEGKKLDHKIDDNIIEANQKKVMRIDLNPFFVNAFVSKKNKKGQFRYPKDISELILKHEIVGINYERKVQLMPYTISQNLDQEIRAYHEMFKSNVNELPFAFINADSITFKKGKYSIDHTIVIPHNTKLFIEEGFELDLLNQSSLLSYSAVNFNGTKEHPIRFYSTDSTAGGILVTNTNSMSRLNHCHFDNLANPNNNGWTLTGAVNFHESNVTITNSFFINNRCEDYLNIIRSEFTLKNSTITNSKSDAFDGDFVNGTIENCDFINSGNDGIDVSGSELLLKGIFVDNPMDKAISGGEKSNIRGGAIKIHAGEIGIVCKDMSTIELKDIEVLDTRLAIAVFQKKSEYGKGKIDLENIQFTNNELDYLVETGSTLTIDNVSVERYSDNVIAQMYGGEYGKSSK